MLGKYYLVGWPESQQWIGEENCYICTEVDGAVFVPCDVYDETQEAKINYLNQKL